jgi:NAD+ kinase
MCVSTAVGSTGYNKSLHGAVVLPSVEVFQMTEIASINSNLYHTLSSPLILSKNDVIKLTSEWNKELFITSDSMSLSFKDFKSLEIGLSDKKARLINRNIDYIDRIKKNFI